MIYKKRKIVTKNNIEEKKIHKKQNNHSEKIVG